MPRGKKRSLQIEHTTPEEKSSDALPETAAEARGDHSTPGHDPEPSREPDAGNVDGVEADDAAEKDSGGGPQKIPRCPNCGWRNVRLSHSTGPIDTIMKMFSVAPFRCRSCGTRFRRRWVVKEKKSE